MIAGATRGAGGRALGAHVASLAGGQDVRMGDSRGLVSDNIRDQVAELTDIASHSRAARPVYHVHADPPPGAAFDDAAWNRYWMRFEKELGLERQPFAEQVHIKEGREHRHRQYSLVRSDGTTMPLSHDHARREKIGRVTELEEGQRLTPGAHNRAVLAALDREGRADVAAAMRAAGLDTMPRPRAATTPRERHQVERTGVSKADVGAAALAAWRSSDGGPAFAAALAEQGLRLAQGHKTPQIIDTTGATHDLRRALAAAMKAEGGAEKITAASVHGRLVGIDLPAVGEARQGTPLPEPPQQPDSPPLLTTPADPVPQDAPTASAPEHGPAPVPDPTPRRTSTPDRTAGTTAPTSTDMGDTVAPIDPTKPGDADRFMREWAAAQAKKQARAAAPNHHGGHHASTDRSPGHLAELLDAIEARNPAPATGLDGQPRLRVDGRDNGRRQDHERPPFERLQGHGPDVLRRPPDSPSDRIADRSADAAGPAAGPGADPARPGDRAATDHRRSPDPDGSAHARHRIQARRAAHGLAIVAGTSGDVLTRLTATLRQPPTAERMRQDALAASDARAARVLAQAPWSDPATRDATSLAGDMHEARMTLAAERDARAQAARAAAQAARSRIGFLDRLAGTFGVRTAAVQDADVLDTLAIHAECARDGGRELHDELSGFEGQAKRIIRGREAERSAWSQRPDVVAARREHHGNDLVRAAAASGDTRIAHLAAADLPAARREMLRREAEQIRLTQETLRTEKPTRSEPTPGHNPERRRFP